MHKYLSDFSRELRFANYQHETMKKIFNNLEGRFRNLIEGKLIMWKMFYNNRRTHGKVENAIRADNPDVNIERIFYFIANSIKCYTLKLINIRNIDILNLYVIS